MKIILFILLFLNIVFANSFDDAMKAYKNGEYKKAIEFFGKAANQGYSMAQYNLGVMYYEGIGLKQNKNEAYNLWLKAAKQGSLIAQKNLDMLCKQSSEVCK